MAMKTRAQIEQEILDRLTVNNIVSIFWISEFQYRACAFTRLEKAGRIRLCKEYLSRYPMCKFAIVK
jgi:hypothetical protein